MQATQIRKSTTQIQFKNSFEMHNQYLHRHASVPSHPQLCPRTGTVYPVPGRPQHVTVFQRNDGAGKSMTADGASHLPLSLCPVPSRDRRRARQLHRLRAQSGPELWLPPSAKDSKNSESSVCARLGGPDHLQALDSS